MKLYLIMDTLNWEELCGRALVNSYESFNWWNCRSLWRLESIWAVRMAVLSTQMTRSSRWSGEIAYHYSYLQYGRVVRKGSFQLVRLLQVVQVVKLHIITLTYNLVELWGRRSFQLVQLVQVVKLLIITLTLLLQYGRVVRKGVLSTIDT